MPFPCDLRAVNELLSKSKGKTIKVGCKSDPFMWLDHKYQVTKAVLKLANRYGVKLVLHTMSDLCSHEDYADLIIAGGHTIVMQMGFEHYKFRKDTEVEQLERMVSPGAPSIKRRNMAVDKLRAKHIHVRLEYTCLRELIVKPGMLRELCRRTGTGESYWTGR